MTEICGQYHKFLAEHGVHEPTIKSYIVKRRLAMHFGDRLQFHRPSSGREQELVYSFLASDGTFIERYKKSVSAHAKDVEELTLQSELLHTISSTAVSDQATLLKTSYFLRRTVKSVKTSQPHRPLGANLSIDKVEEFIPDLLYNFVATIVNGCGEVECQLETEKVKVTSLQRHKRICRYARTSYLLLLMEQ